MRRRRPTPSSSGSTPADCSEIDLEHIGLGVRGAAVLGAALESNELIARLYLSGNRIGAEGARLLATALSKNRALKELYLSGNDVGSEGAAALGAALAKNEALAELGLSANGIDDAGAEALATALEANSALTSLTLGSNRIGDEGAMALVIALQVCISLLPCLYSRLHSRLHLSPLYSRPAEEELRAHRARARQQRPERGDDTAGRQAARGAP